ncbi:MAG TPA: arginine--tRNA ligase [Ignavibacteria bacterium]|nr:arginine--tRNA ligase [Bacteroidota bacterium]HRI84090.1 arginine--tRNA ligase [Ignavibacteria bacterium]HRK00020.1 arginine--tRNA ligase [Ignavibacteria bacterium]
MSKLKEQVAEIIYNAVKESGYQISEIYLDKPKDEKFGDLSSNAAMTLAREFKLPPRKIAEEIISKIKTDDGFITKAEIAGAGFINFFLSDNCYKDELKNILSEGKNYGRSSVHSGQSANLEWVSANPTGPLHTGHGRQLCLGKAIANLLEWTGYKVTREYYYNDAGNQMNNLALSVRARYMQIFQKDFPFPEDGYVGDYVKIIAENIFAVYSDKMKDSADLDFFRKEGEKYTFDLIKKTLTGLGINHDIFFNESSLYENSEIEKTLEAFKSKGLSYEKDGAVWLKMDEEKGFQKDKVLVKSSGEPTYRLPDIAYHIDKIKRGYDLIIDIFGSDHGDTYKEVLYGVNALGYDSDKIKVIIHQMVTFKMGTESVKMSKRSDNVYYLEDLINDIGADAMQFFYVMRGANSHLDFDISLAKDKSEKNPVYYIQYAHARICGILRNAGEVFPSYAETDLTELNTEIISSPEEMKLLKILSDFPDEVISSAKTFEPHKIITYLNSVAENFHRFYHNNRVIDAENKELSISRIHICLAVKQILKNGFDIIGISAPERMY